MGGWLTAINEGTQAGASTIKLGVQPGSIALGAEAGASALGALGIAGVAIPVLDIASVAGLILSALGVRFGPDPRNVPSAKIEQIFEAAADNVLSAYKAGLLTARQANDAMVALLRAGDAYYAQYPQLGVKTGSPGYRGRVNMERIVRAEAADILRVQPAPEYRPSSAVSVWHSHYVIIGRLHGWYPESITEAIAYNDAIMQQLIPSQVANPPVKGGQNAKSGLLGAVLVGAVAVLSK